MVEAEGRLKEAGGRWERPRGDRGTGGEGRLDYLCGAAPEPQAETEDPALQPPLWPP